MDALDLSVYESFTQAYIFEAFTIGFIFIFIFLQGSFQHTVRHLSFIKHGVISWVFPLFPVYEKLYSIGAKA